LRPFKARLDFVPLAGHRGTTAQRGSLLIRRGVLGVGRFRSSLGDALWLARATWITDSRRGTTRSTVTARATAGDSQACVRLKVVARRGGRIAGSFRVVGATGSAAGLHGAGKVRVVPARDGSLRLGVTPARQGARSRAIPASCGALNKAVRTPR
jgi:hypothetical protein